MAGLTALTRDHGVVMARGLRAMIVVAAIAGAVMPVAATAHDDAPGDDVDDRPERVDLRASGVFGFPQAQATVLADTDDLRLSAYTDAQHLYVQAIIWGDDDDALGQTNDGRPIGDWSSLVMDVDADGEITPNVDRSYTLNPWPTRPGVRYSMQLGGGASTGIQVDDACRGALRYVTDAAGKRVRVDSFLIPLASLEREVGDAVRLAYWGSSPAPELVVNSVGYEAEGRYYAHHLSHDQYHEITLTAGDVVVLPDAVPNGREDNVPEAVRPAPMGAVPTVGEAPPDLVASDWINIDGPVTLADLRSKVVVVEFWATWCGPCVAGIPHLNELHDTYADEGLRIVSFTDQSREHVEAFMKETPMRYALGTGSQLSRTYGVTGIPHAFVIGRDGLLRWHGHPGTSAFDEAIKEALSQD